VVAPVVKHLKDFVFGPCTLGRTWGTRPEPLTVFGGADISSAHLVILLNRIA
jgi:hypothetical protein